MPLNRLVAFVLGPAITLVAGYVSLWLSRHFPGAHLPDQKSIEGVLTTGALTLTPMVLAHLKIKKWLEGWQSFEKRVDEATHGALSESTQRFLEAVAEKSGVPLPSGVNMASLGGGRAPGGVEFADVGEMSERAATVEDGEPPPALAPDAFEDDEQQG